MKQTLALLVLLAGSCAEPGRNIDRHPNDFAFIEVTLKG